MMGRGRGQFGPIAVDLGGHRVKLMQLSHRDGQAQLSAWAELCPPEDADTAERMKWLKGALREAIDGRGFRGRRVVTALGPGEFELKNVRLPTMPAEELRAAAEFEAHERFAMKPEQAEFRHLVAGQVRHGSEVREEVIVLASPRNVIDERIALLTETGLEPVALDITPSAMARCFVRFLRRAEDASAVNVFVDVGWRGTSLCVTRGAEVCFVKLFDIGGAAFTKALASRLELSEADALRLRVKIIGAAAQKQPAPADVPPELLDSAADAVRPVVEQLAREVQLSMRYFSVTFRGQRPECLTFVGGEAHEPMLIPVITNGLDIPCTVGDPLRGLRGTAGLAERSARCYRPAWAVATGLAFRGLVPTRRTSVPTPAPVPALATAGEVPA